MAAPSGSSSPPGAAPQAALLLRTSGVDAALPLADVREVLACPMLTVGPGQPPFIAGFFALDGQAALVLRLDRLLGLRDSPEDLYAPLIRLAGPGPARLLLVERAVSVVPVTDPVPAGPEESFNSCVTARFGHDGRLVHLLDRARLLLNAEEAATRAYSDAAATRLTALLPSVVESGAP